MSIKIPVFILLLVFSVLALSSAMRTSGTCDEIAHHIPVGYVLLTKGDLKMDTSQPPLPRYIVALPLKLFANINMPDDKKEWRVENRSDFARDFFYKYNKDPNNMILLCRLPVIIIGILCGILLFVWAKSLYGERPALPGLFLYCFSPNILAHAGLATTDMIATLFIFLSIYAFWLFLCDPSFKNSILSGFCLGLAQLSKYNAVLLYPIFLLFSLFELSGTFKGKKGILFLKISIVLFVSIVVMWGGYGFDLQPLLKDAVRVEDKITMLHNVAHKLMPNLKDFKTLDRFLLQVPVPLGSHILGVMGVYRHFQAGHNSYFLGRWSIEGNPFYFLVAFLIKNPVSTLIFLAAGLFVTFTRRMERGERLILVTALSFFVVSSLGNLQIGLRHILPLFPLCFIIAGRSEKLFKGKMLSLVMCTLLAWQAVSTVLAWPNYLAYFNESIGGPKNGYKYLRDSNLDWGQDLPALKGYMDKNGLKDIKLLYFGEAAPGSYGINNKDISDAERKSPKDDIYAVSVNYLESIEWTRHYEPTARAGYSIFIYDLRWRQTNERSKSDDER